MANYNLREHTRELIAAFCAGNDRAFAELYDGDPPHEPHGAIASALSTAALLYVDYLIEKYKEDRK